MGTLRATPASRESTHSRDAALLVARVALAWIFIYHGARTLFGAFHGPGLHAMASYFATTAGLHPGMLFAVANGVIEFGGGIAIGLGVLTRLAAAGLVVDMVMAFVTVTRHNGLVSNAPGSGYEINLALAALAAVVVLLGPGRLGLGGWWHRTPTRVSAD
ncbi:MAG: DoxX family protein [Acidimicrobiales bacterium]